MTFGLDQCPRCANRVGDHWSYTFYGGTVRACPACLYPVEWGDAEGTHEAYVCISAPNPARQEVPA